MADIEVTSADVAVGSGATLKTVVAGATIVAGRALYLDSADGKYKLSIADGSAGADEAGCDGISLCGAANGQPLVIAVPSGGNIDLGATLVVGETYVVSADNQGGIAPIGDLASTNFVIILGIATAADNLRMKLIEPGIQKA